MLKRNIKITFRMNHKECDHLKRLVKRSGLSQEAYLRQLVKGVIPRDALPPDYFSMMRALYAVGDTLNQIAVDAQACGMVDAAGYYEAVQLFKRVVDDITAAVILPKKY